MKDDDLLKKIEEKVGGEGVWLKGYYQKVFETQILIFAF